MSDMLVYVRYALACRITPQRLSTITESRNRSRRQAEAYRTIALSELIV